MSSSNSTARAAPSAADANVDVSADASVQNNATNPYFLQVEKEIEDAVKQAKKRKFLLDSAKVKAQEAERSLKKARQENDEEKMINEVHKRSMEAFNEQISELSTKNKHLAEACAEYRATIQTLQQEWKDLDTKSKDREKSQAAEIQRLKACVTRLLNVIRGEATEETSDDDAAENNPNPDGPPQPPPGQNSEQATNQRLITAYMSIRKPTSTPTTGATTTSTPHQQLLQDDALIVGEGDPGQDDAHSREGGGQRRGADDAQLVHEALKTSPSARASDATPTSADVDVSTPQQSEPRGSPSQPEVPSSSTVHKVHSARLATSGSSTSAVASSVAHASIIACADTRNVASQPVSQEKQKQQPATVHAKPRHAPPPPSALQTLPPKVYAMPTASGRANQRRSIAHDKNRPDTPRPVQQMRPAPQPLDFANGKSAEAASARGLSSTHGLLSPMFPGPDPADLPQPPQSVVVKIEGVSLCSNSEVRSTADLDTTRASDSEDDADDLAPFRWTARDEDFLPTTTKSARIGEVLVCEDGIDGAWFVEATALWISTRTNPRLIGFNYDDDEGRLDLRKVLTAANVQRVVDVQENNATISIQSMMLDGTHRCDLLHDLVQTRPIHVTKEQFFAVRLWRDGVVLQKRNTVDISRFLPGSLECQSIWDSKAINAKISKFNFAVSDDGLMTLLSTSGTRSTSAAFFYDVATACVHPIPTATITGALVADEDSLSFAVIGHKQLEIFDRIDYTLVKTREFAMPQSEALVERKSIGFYGMMIHWLEQSSTTLYYVKLDWSVIRSKKFPEKVQSVVFNEGRDAFLVIFASGSTDLFEVE